MNPKIKNNIAKDKIQSGQAIDLLQRNNVPQQNEMTSREVKDTLSPSSVENSPLQRSVIIPDSRDDPQTVVDPSVKARVIQESVSQIVNKPDAIDINTAAVATPVTSTNATIASVNSDRDSNTEVTSPEVKPLPETPQVDPTNKRYEKLLD